MTTRESAMTTDLEQRLRAVEDRLEIYNLIASHPLSADTAASDYTFSVYLEDSVFEREGFDDATGREAIAAILVRPTHLDALDQGMAHFAGLPHIALSGDTAVVTSYLQIIVPERRLEEVEVPNHGASKGFRIHRMVANRWELMRMPGGWKIKRRTISALDGSESARKLLHRALESQKAE
jgi:hypothetical protein